MTFLPRVLDKSMPLWSASPSPFTMKPAAVRDEVVSSLLQGVHTDEGCIPGLKSGPCGEM